MPHDTIHALVVDDELLARQRLVDLLESRGDVRTIDTAEHGEEAIEIIQEQDPDLVFLDIQMPGESGLDVVREVGADDMPVTIFVTAFDEYALKAFDLAALDYLLKPFDDDRFEQAFARAKKAIKRDDADDLHKQLRTLIDNHDNKDNPRKETSEQKTIQRLAVESRGQTLILPVSEIRYISASGPYLEIHTDDDTYLLRERMKTIDNNLDHRFFRIHRSTIVQLNQIEALVNESAGSYTVKLANGETLPVSRRRRSELEDILGLNL